MNWVEISQASRVRIPPTPPYFAANLIGRTRCAPGIIRCRPASRPVDDGELDIGLRDFGDDVSGTVFQRDSWARPSRKQYGFDRVVPASK
jgi:hypothetical protein